MSEERRLIQPLAVSMPDPSKAVACWGLPRGEGHPHGEGIHV